MIKKLLSLLNLFIAEIFCNYKLIEIIIVDKNKNFEFIVFKIISTGFKSLNNDQKFIVSSLISNFCKNYFLKKI